ncbi:hypothetical protein RHECNPAF_730014 [Rhizobium etli CNPAF512]|nr:hypothetical protein RHECNPAF_730014 [Rhizobium etli CNPAF512]
MARLKRLIRDSKSRKSGRSLVQPQGYSTSSAWPS